MALTATVFKAELQIADMDRGYYGDHTLTMARHPSETDERMMVRLLAYALNASEGLSFTKGLSADEEPDLWRKTLTDEVDLWIEVGLPEEKRLRRACNRAREVHVYAYGGRGARQWWDKHAQELRRHENLRVVNLPYEATRALESLVNRGMRLQCTVQDGQVWLTDGERTVTMELERWQGE